MVRLPVLFNIVDSINIEDWHKNKLVVFQKAMPVGVLLNLSQTKELQHLVHIEVSRDQLSCMSRTCHQDGWLPLSNFLTTSWKSFCFLFLFIFSCANIACIINFVVLGLNEWWFLRFFTFFRFFILSTYPIGKFNDIDVSALETFTSAVGLGNVWEVMLDTQHQVIHIWEKEMVETIRSLNDILTKVFYSGFFQ